MRFFIAGVMQGSSYGNDVIDQDYREVIREVIERQIPEANVYDPWADHKGEYLSGFYASPVYALYDLEGLATEEMPPVNQHNLSGHIGYHIRSGEHDQTYYDWNQFINFADKYFK